MADHHLATLGSPGGGFVSASTVFEVDGIKCLINGRYTYEGTFFEQQLVEGLLFNVRAIQATFDDENYPETDMYLTDVGARSFVYPDTLTWDAERNTDEFAAALPSWRAHGILGVTLGFQGGRPALNAWQASPWCHVYQPHQNSGFDSDGALKPAYAARMARAIAALDELGMVAIVSLFYFGQDHWLRDDQAVVRAVDEATQWLLNTGHRNVILEVANEIDGMLYQHPSLKPDRVHELVDRVKNTTLDGRRLLVSASYTSRWIPRDNVTAISDVVIPHGNGYDGDGHRRMIQAIRNSAAFRQRPQPIIINEASTDVSCLDACLASYASWGYYDHGKNDYRDGFQSPPINWTINTPAKRAFFERVREITRGR
jgi:hypothetical protein